MNRNFVVIHSLIAPVILGVDFLQKYNLVLDFPSNPVSIISKTVNEWEALPKSMKPLIDVRKKKICAVEANDEPAGKAIDSCVIPLFGKVTLPTYDVLTISVLLNSCWQCWRSPKILFSSTPGHTELAEHFIPTTGTPVKIPPRRILANCRAEVEEQIQTMLMEGIIEESSSPWMAPAVFVRKNGDDIMLEFA